MFQKILVPLDGSSLSERALPVASAVAQATGARLILVRAVWPHTLPGMDEGKAQAHAIQEAAAYLAEVVKRLGDSLLVETAVPLAHASQGILLEAESRQANLIVMTTHGRSGLSRWVYGSVAEAVLAQSSIPVWLIRMTSAGATAAPRNTLDQRPHILVPLDGSTFAESALPYASELARALDWTISLLRVVVPPGSDTAEPEIANPYITEQILLERKVEAEQYLNAMTESLKQEGLRVQSWLRVGQAAAAITDECIASGASLIVMATHGRTGLGRVLYGSVASEILHRSSLPLLLIRPASLAQRHAEALSAAAQ